MLWGDSGGHIVMKDEVGIRVKRLGEQRIGIVQGKAFEYAWYGETVVWFERCVCV